MMRLLFFGIAKDIVGQREISDYTIGSDATVSDLLENLKNQYPRLSELSSIAIGVNQEYASESHKLNVNDEVALIPPVSGG